LEIIVTGVDESAELTSLAGFEQEVGGRPGFLSAGCYALRRSHKRGE
jgi:hypothetical protein